MIIPNWHDLFLSFFFFLLLSFFINRQLSSIPAKRKSRESVRADELKHRQLTHDFPYRSCRHRVEKSWLYQFRELPAQLRNARPDIVFLFTRIVQETFSQAVRGGKFEAGATLLATFKREWAETVAELHRTA